MKFITLTILLSMPAYSFSAEDLSQKIMELRSQVQIESDQLEAMKKSLNSSIQSLTIEKGELESRKKMLSLQNIEMKRALAEKKRITQGEESKDFTGYTESIDEGFKKLQSYYKKAIPFKLKDREKKISKIQEKFRNKEINLAEYTEKYWSHLQDEIRLTNSVEVQSENITIDDETMQVKVLKMGMFQLYFKTFDGRYGVAKKTGVSWEYSFIANSKYKTGIEKLIASKEKQVSGGVYELPIYLTKQGGF